MFLADRRRRDRARRSASKTRSSSISDRTRTGSGRVNSGRSNRDLNSAKSRGSGSVDSRENSDYNLERRDPDTEYNVRTENKMLAKII